MELTFREKSLAVQLIGLMAAVLVYFNLANPLASTAGSTSTVFQLVALVVTIIFVNIIGHILVAVFGENEDEDERDKLIQLKAYKASSVVLSGGVVLAILASMLFTDKVALVPLLFLTLLGAEIIEKMVQLGYYRKGV